MGAPRHRQRRPDRDQLLGRLRRTLVQLRFNTLVVADPEVGREVADAFAAMLEAEGQEVRRIDATGVESPFELLSCAGEPESTDIPTDDWMGLAMKLAATSHQHDQPRFIIVDGIPDPDIGFGLFGKLRDYLWVIHYRWATFIPPDELGHYTVHPADTFFPTVIHIDDRQQ
ncbi:MAG: hypothetical protein GY722_23690 [bacterium]|nr:hypothetical protein [bacterium]